MAPKRARSESLRKTSTTATDASTPASTTSASASKTSHAHAHAQKSPYEFGGPIGAFLVSFGLPVVTYALAFVCNDVSGCPAPSLLSPSKLFSAPPLSTQSGWEQGIATLKEEVGWPGVAGLLNLEAVVGTLAWYALSLVLYAVLPAYEAQGTELRSGGRLTYRMNALFSAITTLVACAAGTWVLGADFQVWAFINRNYIQILTTNIVLSYILATYVYVLSFSVTPGNAEKRELAAGGHSGNVIYDWFIGRELNPRVTIPLIGEVDIKAFMEVRPGMLGWFMLDLAFAAKQYKTFGYLSDSMVLVTAIQGFYIIDSVWTESSILTMIDLTTDGFGFMLAFGDLAWVPFVFSLQAKYLSVHPVSLGIPYIVLTLAIAAAGYLIFRQSNGEKNAFRNNPADPAVAHLKYMPTARGTRLLTSGWWGVSRHPNYLGDWLFSWAYCLPTLVAGYKLTPSVLYPGMRLVSTEGMAGYAIPITYFYMIYFTVLLIHRERRDDEACRKKYGSDWDEYCKLVRWRIIPGIY